ncbi:hypothetical protein RUND412_008815 [Rhizina undulata]
MRLQSPFQFPPQTQYINGAPSGPSSSPNSFTTYNPSTGLPLALVHSASPADLHNAVSSATEAFKKWSKTTPLERSRILLKAVSILRERNDEIARVETLDTGKAFVETSTVDIATGADVLEFFAGACVSELEGKTVKLGEEKWCFATREPLGVCVGIGAWNYPIQIALWKSAPALAAGNTFIFKPSEITPLSAYILAEIYTAAGLPPGVFNVVHGGPEIGKWLCESPQIAKVSFTGQVSTGRKVYTTAGNRLIPVTLELGGKSPMIIFADVDLEHAVDCALTANFFSSGQVCTAGTRVFVHESIKGAFETLLLKKLKDGIRLGDPLNSDTNFGPLVSKAQMKKVSAYINHGISVDNATLLTETEIDLRQELRNGYFVPPTIFTNCTDTMKIVREEIFGPVMCILSFSTETEVLKRANDSELGLAAGVFTSDVRRAHRVAGALNAGIVWVNGWGDSPAEMPVGGWGDSGVGFENGRECLKEFGKWRSVLVDGGRGEGWFAAKL